MVSEQRLIGIAFVRLHTEQYQPGCLAVNTVNRNKRVNAQALFKPHQKRLLQEMTGRCDRQKMRLVGNDQVLILKQDHLIKRNALLLFNSAVIVDAHVARVGTLSGNEDAELINHQIIGHAL